MPIADTVVSALDFHVEGRRLDSRVCAFHSLVLCGYLCDCVVVLYSRAMTWSLREGESGRASPWCM